jgi:glycosyltransferase involved in cell wall biosynthesis
MKLFEYMASERSIVASDLPSVREILPADAGYFAKADDADSFARSIREALGESDSAARIARARSVVDSYTWKKRAERILERII